MKSGILVCLVMGCCACLVWAQGSSWQSVDGYFGDVRSVVVHPEDPAILFAGTGQGAVMKTDDGGRNWRRVLSLSGERPGVNHVIIRAGRSTVVYAAADNGLYCSYTGGKNWKRIFRGKNSLESQCTAMASLSGVIFLGTRGGLFMSEDNGRTWSKTGGELKNSTIVAMSARAGSPGTVYAAGWNVVVCSEDGGKSWEKIFSGSPEVLNNRQEEYPETEEKADGPVFIRSMAVEGEGTVYIATSREVYRKYPGQRDWERLMEQGLSGRDIHCITVTARQKLIAAGLSEVFMNDNGAWREASNGLRVNKIRSLCADKQDRLYAATSKGIYTFDLRRPSVFFETDKTNSRTPEEGRKTNNPSIALIQKAAIEYAEVHNEKIKTWRSQAAKRALFPTVSVGVDRDRNRSTSSNTWGTYGSNGSPGKCFIGPEDSSADNNENWSVSLSWDLGDLVWNDAQTAIDVRSKLMVELRGQILDEVTKLYFERLRLIREIDELGIEERKKRSDKELKVQEVTAMLDGLTGGMFSRGQE